MTTLAEFKQAILDIPKIEYAEIVEWLNELEEDEWDRQIEQDAKAGRSDALAAESWEAKANGTLKEIV